MLLEIQKIDINKNIEIPALRQINAVLLCRLFCQVSKIASFVIFRSKSLTPFRIRMIIGDTINSLFLLFLGLFMNLKNRNNENWWISIFNSFVFFPG